MMCCRLPVVAADDRARVLESWGKHCHDMVPQEHVLEFAKIRKLSPEQFVEKLAKELKVKGAVAGKGLYEIVMCWWDENARNELLFKLCFVICSPCLKTETQQLLYFMGFTMRPFSTCNHMQHKN